MSAGRWIALLLAASLTAGCSLAGDITPPPDLATAQAAQPAIAPVVPESGQAFAPPPTPPDLASGAMLFAERCAPCHGPAGLGDGQQAAALSIPPTALGAPEVSQTATGAAWYDVVTRGRIERFMPPFVSLSDQQRWDVVAYALSLGTPQQSVQDGVAIYQAKCAACHGEYGQGGTVGPALTDPQQLAERSLAATVALIQQGRGQMPPFADELSEDEQQAAAAFVRSLSLSAPTASVPPTAQAQPAATSAGTPAEPAPEAGTPSAIEATAEPALPVAAVIRGTVSNATPSGKVPAGLGVTLKGFDGDVEVVSEQSQLGHFRRLRLRGRRNGPRAAVLRDRRAPGPELRLGGRSPAASAGQPGSAGRDLRCDRRAQLDLAIERLHTLFDFSIDGTLRVIELWILTNQGEQTIAPAEGIAVTLPDGATDLQFENGQVGQRFLLNATGFADMEPVAPGQGSGELVFSYSLPYERRLAFEQPVSYPVSAVVLLSPEPGPKLQAEGLQDMGEREISTGVIRTYGLGPVAAGDALRVNLSGRPAASSATGSLPPNLGLAIGLAAVGLALIAAGLLWFRPKREAPEPEESPPPTDPEREGLLPRHRPAG